MTTDHIRIGVVGAGGNTRAKHIPLLQAIAGVEIISVCNRSKESGDAVARDFDISQVYEDWRKLVAADDIDAVVIGTWPNMHHDVTLAALDAGKHVMVEARIARNASEAEAMYTASQHHPELVCQVVPAPFTLAVDQTVRRLILEDYIGAVLAADVRFAPPQYLDPKAPMSWRQDREISGNNIMALGICYESLMRWIGPADSVLAQGMCYVNKRRDADGTMRHTDIPEHLDVLAEMHCGAAAHLRISAISGLAAENEFRLLGSKGTLIVRGETLLGGQQGDQALKPIEIPKKERGSWRVEEEFINAIRGQEAISHTTFADGVRYMRFGDAVHDSIHSGERQRIPHLHS